MVAAISLEAVAKMLRTLSDPNRLKIIQVLTVDCQFVSDIVRLTGLPQPLVSHHLRVLREQGLAQFERNGAYITYCLIHPAVRETVEKVSELAGTLQEIAEARLK